MKQLELDEKMTVSAIRATWGDVQASIALIEDELNKSFDLFQNKSGYRARLLIKHANTLLKEMMSLSKHYDNLVKSHASK